MDCISFQLQGPWSQVGSMASTIMGIFTAWSFGKAKSQGFIYYASLLLNIYLYTAEFGILENSGSDPGEQWEEVIRCVMEHK